MCVCVCVCINIPNIHIYIYIPELVPERKTCHSIFRFSLNCYKEVWLLFLLLMLFVCVCVCGEREREREGECMSAYKFAALEVRS